MDEIRILQLGTEDWNKRYQLPKHARLTYAPEFTKAPKKPYDIVFLDRQPKKEEYDALFHATRAYTLFVTEQVAPEGQMEELYACKCGQMISSEQLQQFFLQELRFFFSNAYGKKLQMTDLAVAKHFSGTVQWNGSAELTLNGNYGDSMKQAAYWRSQFPIHLGQVMDVWLEYEKDAGVSIELELTLLAAGSQAAVLARERFCEEELAQVVRVEGVKRDGLLFASVRAKGEGVLKIRGLHIRNSRGDHGHLLPGGVRLVTSEREEIFAYFDPGDKKPPLNVFFSGQQQVEGFEGYDMMRSMHSPFLLLTETRLEGGSFYLGSEEFETKIIDTIKQTMTELGFSPDQVVFSGLSMGSSGALYYGSVFGPHAVIVGKPLVNIGNVAANEKWMRPGGFPASLDVLQYLTGSTDPAAVLALNRRFWDRFDVADWSNTKFIVAYMLEDDYDPEGYATLLEHLQSGGVQVYGKGIHGRQNDSTSAVLQWFTEQYGKVFSEDFGRGDKK